MSSKYTESDGLMRSETTDNANTTNHLSNVNYEGGSKPTNKHVLNSFMMSVGFFLMFSAFNGTSNLLTSGKDPNIGYVASAIIYAFFAFGSLFVSTGVLSKIGPKWSIPLGAITYTIFQTTNLKGQDWWIALWISAGLLGIGASVLWAAEGSYLTIAAKNHAFTRGLPADASQGMFQGMFFGILQLNQVVGNLCAGFIFMYASSGADVLMRVYLGLSIVGLIVLFLLRSEKEMNIIEDKGEIPVLQRVGAVIKLHFDVKILLMIPVLFYSGMEQGFLVGDLTKAIAHGIVNEDNPNYGKAFIGFSMTIFGVVDATCSFCFGKFLIKSHKRIVLLIGTVGHLALYTFIIYTNKTYGGMETIFSSHIWSIFLCTACAGIADSVWNVAPATLLGMMFPDDSESAFSTLKLWQAIGAFSILMIGDHAPLWLKTIFVGIVLIISALGVLVLDILYLSKKKTEYVRIE